MINIDISLQKKIYHDDDNITLIIDRIRSMNLRVLLY